MIVAARPRRNRNTGYVCSSCSALILSERTPGPARVSNRDRRPGGASVKRPKTTSNLTSETSMPEPRIAPIEPPYPPPMQAEFDKLMRGAPPLLLFRTVAHNPRVLQRMMAGGLLDRGSISLRSPELMILRTC